MESLTDQTAPVTGRAVAEHCRIDNVAANAGMHLGRYATPEDVGWAARFLASPKAATSPPRP